MTEITRHQNMNRRGKLKHLAGNQPVIHFAARPSPETSGDAETGTTHGHTNQHWPIGINALTKIVELRTNRNR